MIRRLLDLAGPRTEAADAVRGEDDTITVQSGPGVWPIVSRTESTAWHLRVQAGGRLGMAGSVDPGLETLVDRALTGARSGPPFRLHLPVPSPLPNVRTHSRAAGVLGGRDLADLAASLATRVDGPARNVAVWAERTMGRVEVANSRGVLAGYDRTLVGLGLRLTVPDALPFHLHTANVDPPSLEQIERLVEETRFALHPVPVIDDLETGEYTIGLAPRAAAALAAGLDRLVAELSGGPAATPLPPLSPLLNLTDDPLADGRCGSRPIDDDGVVTRRVALVREGRVVGWRCDLQTGEALGMPSTGHGARRPFSPPRVAPSNTVVEAGASDLTDLPARIGRGILVQVLPSPGTRRAAPHLAVSTPWAYRVERGEVTGRFRRLTLKGGLLEWLGRVQAVGDRLQWSGAIASPALVLEGITAGSRP